MCMYVMHDRHIGQKVLVYLRVGLPPVLESIRVKSITQMTNSCLFSSLNSDFFWNSIEST